jgi:hypothetical protein
MSDVKLPPQQSATDTSNWDDKVFNAPAVSSINKIIKNKERREMILNAPERKKIKRPKNTDIVRSKK